MGNFFCCRRGGILPLGEDERTLLPEKKTTLLGSSPEDKTKATGRSSDKIKLGGTIEKETANNKVKYEPLKNEKQKGNEKENYVEAQNKKMEQKTYFGQTNEKDNQKSNDPLDSADYVDTKTESIDVSGSGYEKSNGEYRWFLHDKKWVKFDNAESFVIDGNVSVADVYSQLQQISNTEKSSFRWPSDVTLCWVISDMEQKHIFYASPMRRADQIPTRQWICVQGDKPEPILVTGQHQSEYHDVPNFLMNNGLNYSIKQNKRNSNGNLKSKHSEQTIPEKENEDDNATLEDDEAVTDQLGVNNSDQHTLLQNNKSNDNANDDNGDGVEEEEELSDLES